MPSVHFSKTPMKCTTFIFVQTLKKARTCLNVDINLFCMWCCNPHSASPSMICGSGRKKLRLFCALTFIVDCAGEVHSGSTLWFAKARATLSSEPHLAARPSSEPHLAVLYRYIIKQRNQSETILTDVRINLIYNSSWNQSGLEL